MAESIPSSTSKQRDIRDIVESRALGLYVNRADQQVIAPPHTWRNMVFQGFILDADEKRLQHQCDKLLNHPLGEARYRVKHPWVLLYFWNVGAWHSTVHGQDVVTHDRGFYVKKRAGLWIPIERMRGAPASQLHFLPFYEFINENVARTSGRETFGQPFDLAKINTSVANAEGFGKDFRVFGGGEPLSIVTRVLDRDRPNRFLQDMELIHLMPSVPSPAAEDIRRREEKTSRLESLARALKAIPGEGGQIPLQLEFSTLKQYRDSTDAHFACYQSVVDFRLNGQVSGVGWLPTKYDLHIKEVASPGIVRSLGLDESRFSSLHSFALSASHVRNELGEEYVPARRAKPCRYVHHDDSQVWPAPFELGNSSFYGFVLPAEVDKLQSVLDKVFEQPTGGAVKYRAFIPAVLLYFADMRRDLSESGSQRFLGTTQEKEAGLWIPMVRIEQGKASYFCVHAYNMFVDSALADATGREVYGIYKELAKINVPDSPSRGFFELRPTVIERFGARARADQEILASISAIRDSFSLEALKQVPLNADYFSKGVRKLMGSRELTPRFLWQFMQSLKNPRFAFLKQFRHARAPERACYQAVVEANFSIGWLPKLGLLPGRYALNVNGYASHPWVDDLGLQPESFNDLSGFQMEMNFMLDAGKVIWESQSPVEK